MSLKTQSPVSQFEAVGLALAGYTCWVLADTCLKIIGTSHLRAYEVVAFVGFGVMILLCGHALWRRNLSLLLPKAPLRQLLRSSLDLANNLCVVVALRHLPLALFYLLIFAAPMVTTLLAVLVLGESLAWKKSVALLLGFLGVVVAADPFGVTRPGDWKGYFACLVCVSAFSANMVWSRAMTRSETPESLTFTSGAFMAAAGAVCMLHQSVPLTGKLTALLGATSLFSVIGSLCFFVALRHAAAATVAQYHYSQLVTGAVIGYVLWHETLTASMVAGAALIIAAGWYTAVRS